jgi:hypothetical protein
VRLRPLTEAECYARCYGDIHTDQVIVLRRGDAGGAIEPAGAERAEDGAAELEQDAA